MRAADQWGIIMSITGLLYGLMNYVVWYRGLNDYYWGIDRSGRTPHSPYRWGDGRFRQASCENCSFAVYKCGKSNRVMRNCAGNCLQICENCANKTELREYCADAIGVAPKVIAFTVIMD